MLHLNNELDLIFIFIISRFNSGLWNHSGIALLSNVTKGTASINVTRGTDCSFIVGFSFDVFCAIGSDSDIVLNKALLFTFWMRQCVFAVCVLTFASDIMGGALKEACISFGSNLRGAWVSFGSHLRGAVTRILFAAGAWDCADPGPWLHIIEAELSEAIFSGILSRSL